MNYVVGFDLSLTAPAAVALPVNWKPGDWRAAKSWLLRPTAPKTDDVGGQLVRYEEISTWVCNIASRSLGKIEGVWVEQYAFSKNNAGASRLYELGGIVRMALYQQRGIVAQTVNTSQARCVLLGTLAGIPKGGQKIEVQSALFAAGAPPTYEENQCDAFCCANYALSEVGGVALMCHREPTKNPKKKVAR